MNNRNAGRETWADANGAYSLRSSDRHAALVCTAGVLAWGAGPPCAMTRDCGGLGSGYVCYQGACRDYAPTHLGLARLPFNAQFGDDDVGKPPHKVPEQDCTVETKFRRKPATWFYDKTTTPRRGAAMMRLISNSKDARRNLPATPGKERGSWQ